MSTINGAGTVNTNHPRSETILVASGNQALATAGSLVPNSGYSLNIGNGQLAAMSLSRGATRDYGVFLNAGDTVAQAPVIQLLQGTPNSGDIREVGSNNHVGHKSYVASAPINSKYAIALSASVAAYGQHHSYALGNVAGAAGAFVPQDEATYRFHSLLDGPRQARYFGVNTPDSTTVEFTTPNFTVFSATYTDPVDYIAQNLAYRINMQSQHMQRGLTFTGNKPILSFAVNTAGGAGTTLTDISNLTVGQTFNFMNVNGTLIDFTVTNDFLATVDTWINSGSNNITGDSTIEVINLDNAGTVAGLGTDVVLVMALDNRKAVVTDEIRSTKVRLEPGLSGAFTAATPVALNQLAAPLESAGSGRNWQITYNRLAGMQVHSLERWGFNTNLITPPDYIDENLFYNAVIIYHMDKDLVEYSHVDLVPHKTIILTPADPSTGVTSDAATLASLNDILAPWLNSCNIEAGGAVTFA